MVAVDNNGSGIPATTAQKNNTTSRKRNRKGGGGLASKLFDKFDSDRKYDPFADTDPVIQDSKAGMEALLSMCNIVEINSLCGALGITEPSTRTAKTLKIMSYIREAGRGVEKRFAQVLRLFWEGLLFEYLRSVGHPLRDAEHDPRHFVTRYWRRSMLDPTVHPGFVPFYLQREVKKRDSILQEDKDIRDIRSGLLTREDAVKDTETRVRRQHDYRFVLQFFSASRELHRTLVRNVNYLVNEVEQLRAQVDHNGESINIMKEQFVELETKYDRVVGGLVYRGALQSTVEGALYGVITHGHANMRAIEEMVRRVLVGMDHGPDGYHDATTTRSTVDDETKLPQGVLTNVDYPLITASSSRRQRKVGDQENEVAGQEKSCPSGGGKWAEPRRRKLSEENLTNTTTKKASNHMVNAKNESTRDIDTEPMREETDHAWSSLERVQVTHEVACTRYTNRVEELVQRTCDLEMEGSKAVQSRDEALQNAKQWELRHRALEEQYEEMDKRSKAELALAETNAQDAHRHALEATALLDISLEKATPLLLQLVAKFVPIDTEELGVHLFEELGIDADRYAHVLARKRMFEADLESRALAAIETELQRASEETEIAEQEDAGKRKERGRPKSRGKAPGSSGDKGKGSSRSRSKSTGKQTKAVDKGEKAKGSVRKERKAGVAKSSKSKVAPAGRKADSSTSQASNRKSGSPDQNGTGNAQRPSNPVKTASPKSPKKK